MSTNLDKANLVTIAREAGLGLGDADPYSEGKALVSALAQVWAAEPAEEAKKIINALRDVYYVALVGHGLGVDDLAAKAEIDRLPFDPAKAASSGDSMRLQEGQGFSTAPRRIGASTATARACPSSRVTRVTKAEDDGERRTQAQGTH